MTTRTLVGDGAVGYLGALIADANQKQAPRAHYDTDAALAATLLAVPIASSLATSKTLTAALRTAYEAHRILTTTHSAADSTNTITANDVTDIAHVETQLLELSTDIAAHTQSASGHRSMTPFVVTTTDPAGADQTKANNRANELRKLLLAHLLDGAQTLPATSIGT